MVNELFSINPTKHPKMKGKQRSEAETLSLDRISKLPQSIIEIILCLVPIQDAARTSILSTEWRYKWTKIPKLVFDRLSLPDRKPEKKQLSSVENERKYMDSRLKLLYVIQQVLLLRQGPIHEFTLSMEADRHFFEIDQMILHLSRNHTLKKLKLDLNCEYWYKLPLSAFSMHHLTDLYLHDCNLDHEPTFGGFGLLKSLCLKDGRIPTKALLHLLSNCPSLKSFTLLVDQAELGHQDCTITELFECLPMIEHLTTWGLIFGWLVLDSIPKELPTLTHLKYFCFKRICFYDGHGLTFLAVVLKCSPNLEKVKIKIDTDHHCYKDEILFPNVLEEFSDVWLEHLNELEIKILSDINVKSGLEFVKFIMARSPKLKKVSLWCLLEKDQEFEVLKALLRAPRASLVEIVVNSYLEKMPIRSLKFPKRQF